MKKAYRAQERLRVTRSIQTGCAVGYLATKKNRQPSSHNKQMAQRGTADLKEDVQRSEATFRRRSCLLVAN